MTSPGRPQGGSPGSSGAAWPAWGASVAPEDPGTGRFPQQTRLHSAYRSASAARSATWHTNRSDRPNAPTVRHDVAGSESFDPRSSWGPRRIERKSNLDDRFHHSSSEMGLGRGVARHSPHDPRDPALR